MGINQLRSCCSQQPQQPPINYSYLILTKDYTAFTHQRWYAFQHPLLFDPNKFIFLYPNYQQQQDTLLYRWKLSTDIKNLQYGQTRRQDQVMSYRWKFALKRGVPIEYYKPIISVIFNKNYMVSSSIRTQFERLKLQISSKDRSIYTTNTLHETIYAPFLNQKGLLALRDLLCLVDKLKCQRVYKNYIPHITSLLLIFFQQCQVYDILSLMIEQSTNMSQNRLSSFRWHFVFTEQQITFLASSFYTIVATNSQPLNRLALHFDNNCIDKDKIIINIVERFFYGYLPFPLILTILPLFCNEGVKYFFRICYSILIFCQHELYLTLTLERALTAISKKCLNLTPLQHKLILKNSHTLNLKSSLNSNLYQQSLRHQRGSRQAYYLPTFKGCSNIITYTDLQQIWHFLPYQLKTFDLQLKFSFNTFNKFKTSQSSQNNLTILLDSLLSANFSLIVIRAQSTYSFGCFNYGKLHKNNQLWYGNAKNFVFVLGNKPQKYQSTHQNTFYLHTTTNQFKVGNGSNGPALKLENNLQIGQSYISDTFHNQPLNRVPGVFKIVTIQGFEIY